VGPFEPVEETGAGLPVGCLDEEVVEHGVVKDHDAAVGLEPRQEPEVVGVVPEVDQNDLVTVRRLIRRNHLETGGPIIGSRPARRRQDPNRSVGGEGREQLRRIVRDPGMGRWKRRSPEDPAVSDVAGHVRILPSPGGLDTLSG
jgi:hypothetical protein